ncbi:MAG: TonB-dependent receptor [Ferruginibacter sp.]
MRTFLLSALLTSQLILLAGGVHSQELDKVIISLNVKDESLKQVLKKIEKQTSFHFTYLSDDVNGVDNVSYSGNKITVAQALSDILRNTGLLFEQADKNILIKRSGKTIAIITDKNFAERSGEEALSSIDIKGRVLNEKGDPLEGVTIKVKGTAKITTTTKDGYFSINAENENITLEISYVGYLEQQVTVNGNNNLANIELKPSLTKLNEVVVIGYGNQRKKDITSAISIVDVKDVSSRPMVSAVEAITGKAAGVQISVPSGSPGGDLSVRVRGIGSPNGGEPLYVVDGVLANDIKAIDPNSIESISVLKDASAAGIYGAAGSTNGVVIITTKRGTKGKPKTEVNVYTGSQQIVKKLPVLNNSEWLALQTEINGTAPVIAPYYDLNMTNNNWQDLVYHTAMQTGVNVSTSGGSEKGTFYLGLGYLDQDGIIVGSNFKRYSAKLSIEQSANSWLKIGANFNYNRTDQRTVTDNASANFGGVVISALVTPEYIPVTMPAGAPIPGVYGVSNFYSGENPLSNIYSNTNKTIGNNLLGNVFTEIRLPLEIKYRSQFNASVGNSKYDWFLDPYSSLSGISSGGQGRSNYSEVFRWAWDNTLSYSKIMGNHSIDVVAGTSALNEKIATSGQYGTSFATNAVQTLNGASGNFQVGTARYQWSTNSYFGRLSYSYKDRYLLTATVRRDGSSRVGNKVVWGNFPAVSAGWKVSNEKFMDNVNWMQNLKIRGGWGKTGNLPPYTMLYPSYSLLNAGSAYAYNSGAASPGISPSGQFGNAGLEWESARQVNVGFDVSFLHSNLSLSFDYYHKKVENMIFTQQLPLTTGGAFTALNLPGFDINKGIEFTIEANMIRKKDFDWTTNFNMSFNKNLISGIDPKISFQTGAVSIGGSRAPIYTQIIKDGYSLGTFWGYQSNGVDPETGNLVYGSEPVNLGSALPTYTLGFSNTLRYKPITLSFLIDAVGGNKVYNATRMEAESVSGYANSTDAVLKRWKQKGDKTDIPRALNNGTTNSVAASLLRSQISSHYLEDGSFVRLRNITLSYQFSNDWIKKLGLGGAKLYMTAQNFVTITKYKGYYPEVNGYGQGTNNQATNAGAGASLMSLGIDRGTYPAAKTFTVGVNIQF